MEKKWWWVMGMCGTTLMLKCNPKGARAEKVARQTGRGTSKPPFPFEGGGGNAQESAAKQGVGGRVSDNGRVLQ